MGLDMFLDCKGKEVNVQDGTDDCRGYEVTREQLQELLGIINKILGTSKKEKILNSLGDYNKDLAKKLLPVYTGFFFGGYEYDEWYFKDLVNTQKILTKFLEGKSKGKITYQSSW